MATQIQATPVIRGKMAQDIYEESRTPESEASRRGSAILKQKFENGFTVHASSRKNKRNGKR